MNYILFWVLLIILIVVLITLVLFNLLKSYALFQPTKDEVWYPDIIGCKELNKENSSNLELTEKIHHNRLKKDCKKYVSNFKNEYLVIGDKKRRGFSRKEINQISNSKMFNLSTLPYINVWKFENHPGHRIVLYFHGNNDNISYRKYAVDICNRLKLNLMLVDYRGYGESSGLPSSESLLEDAECAYTHLRNDYKAEEIIIWGESLGGIAAIWTAHKYKCNTLVLLSTFAKTSTIIDKMEVPDSLKNVLKGLAKSPYMQNGKWIKDVDCPTVIIHSTEDDILPYINAELLYNSVDTKKKKLIKILGPHAHPLFSENDVDELLDFLDIKTKKSKKIIEIINNI